MMGLSAMRLGFSPIVLCETVADPAAQVLRNTIFGGWKDPQALKLFLDQSDLVLFENEWVPWEVFDRLGIEKDDPKFFPKLQSMARIQNKLEQKRLLEGLGIASAPYREWKGEDLKSWLEELRRIWKGPVVLKWATHGYDGKGTLIESGSPSDFHNRAIEFLEVAAKKKVSVFAEKKASFTSEWAMVGVQSTAGTFAHYPLVITVQERGICRRVMGPATAFGVKPAFEEEAVKAVRAIGREAGLVGTYAVEFFDHEGKLWVNEIAPRVHNSGHFSQDASECCQFENHLRAVLGWPLGSTRSAPYFAMENILGPRDPKDWVPSPFEKLHDYGKGAPTEGRKMGHLNWKAESKTEFKERGLRLKKEWGGS
jgi:5-(carboxyamino)imidazole ribonucleotide synthase